MSLLLEADFGTVQLYWRSPEPGPLAVFGASFHLGLDNFLAYRATRAARRASGHPGVWESYGHGNCGATVHLEAFGETFADLARACARYFRGRPNTYRTTFNAIEEIDGEFIAHGWRYQQENWT